jgi:hypothetical protein
LVGLGVDDGTGVRVLVAVETVGEEVGVGVNVWSRNSVVVGLGVAADGTVTAAITGGLSGASVVVDGLPLVRIPGASPSAIKPIQ